MLTATQANGETLTTNGTDDLVRLTAGLLCGRSREGDIVIWDGDNVAGVVRLNPDHARLYDMRAGTPVIIGVPYPMCKVAA